MFGILNPKTTGNAWVHHQHCDYWCPCAQAPCHQYPQCWINIHCTGPVWLRNIAFIGNNIRKTRSTLMAQTSVAPNLRNVKQSSQAWISLPQNVHNVPYSILVLFWKFNENPFTSLSTLLLIDQQTNQQRWKHNFCYSEEVIKSHLNKSPTGLRG